MMKLSLVILCTWFALCNAISQEIKPDGHNTFYYPNGRISSEGNMKDGKPVGYWKNYYPNGILKSEGNRVQGLLDSTWVFYNENGLLSKRIEYKLGEKNGYTYTYSHEDVKNAVDGVVISKELYLDNKKEGYSYYYYPDGSLKRKEFYKNGKLHDNTFEYSTDGQIKKIYSYSNGDIQDIVPVNRVNTRGEKTGTWREYYDNGKLKTEQNFEDGRLTGLVREYDKKGNLVQAVMYQKDSVVDDNMDEFLPSEVEIKERFHADGTIKFSGTYIKDVPVGIHRYFNDNGEVTRSEIFDDKGFLLAKGIVSMEGRRNGNWEFYYPGGNIRMKGEYRDNRREGNWKFYFKNGNIEQEGVYNLGRYHGNWKWYFETGELLKEEEYFKGVHDGLSREYNKSGEVLKEGSFVSGEKEGFWKYTINDHTEEGNYVIGLKDGTWKQFYLDGNLRFEGNFIQGNPDGKHTFYYPNGVVKEERYYQNGVKVKNWKKYDENGLLIVTITFRNGEEFRINGMKVEFEELDNNE